MSRSILDPTRGAADTGRAMSQENVAIVQRFADHWNETGEPLWAEMDPEVVFVIDPGSFVAGTYRGHDGIRTLLRLTASAAATSPRAPPSRCSCSRSCWRRR
jgi:hypothetical protein